MKKQRKQKWQKGQKGQKSRRELRRFDWKKGRCLTAKKRLVQNNLTPVARRITDDKVVDGLLMTAMK